MEHLWNADPESVVACAKVCRSMALVSRGFSVPEAALRNILLAKRKGERYCGGCRRWRTTDAVPWKASLDKSEDMSTQHWLRVALDHDYYLDARRLSPCEKWLDDCNGQWNIIAIYNCFVIDWMEGRAWAKNAEFLLESDGQLGDRQMVRWCPTCRAQKVYEDERVCRSIVNESVTIAHQSQEDFRFPGTENEQLVKDWILAKRLVRKAIRQELKGFR